jgi:hypothetical protein
MYASAFYWFDWLYAPRNDGKPRVLRFPKSFRDAKSFIERIKKVYLKYRVKQTLANILQDFTKATCPVSFFVYVHVNGWGNVNWQDICLENGMTKEQLAIKTFDPLPTPSRDMDPFQSPAKKMVLICRYPMGANKGWIEENEQEIMEWKIVDQNRRIRFERSLVQENGGNV